MKREDIAFNADGTTLRGWLYRPERLDSAPVIVMAHGFSAVKEMYLDRYAEVFAKAGLGGVLSPPGERGGRAAPPRQEINPWQQIEDYRHAITYVSILPGIDARRVGIWGTSYSGGHVLVVGATDRRVKCVVAQVPTISGHESGLRRVPADKAAALTDAFAEDRLRRMLGEAPSMRKVAGAPEEQPIYTAKDCVDWFTEGSKIAPSWKNEVTLRTVEWTRAYEPGAHIPHISPTPLLMIVGLQDTITGTDLQLEAFNQALEPKKLALFAGGHFDPYVVRFQESSRAAVDWFVAHL
jgi:dienelactone hydrolase